MTRRWNAQLAHQSYACGGQGECSCYSAASGILPGVVVSTLKRDRARNRLNVAVWEANRHGFEMQLRACAFASKRGHSSLDKRAGRDYSFIAGIDWGSNLGIDVVATMNVAALNRMCENESKARARGNRDRTCAGSLLAALRVSLLAGFRLILRETGKG